MNKELKETIDAEILPLKENINVLTEEKQKLQEENQSLLSEVAAKDSKITTLSEKINFLEETVSKINKRNARLIREAQIISQKAKASVIFAKNQTNEAKRMFVESASVALENHINEVTKSAFSSAKSLFERDFSVVENDVMKELGSILSPYISDKSSPSKIDALQNELILTKKELDSMKETSNLKLRENRMEKRRLENKLRESLAALREAKLIQFKDILVNKLPSSLQETARKDMTKAESLAEVKRIYLSVVKESATVTPEQDKPVVVKPAGVATEAKKPITKEVIKESATVTVKVRKSSVNDEDDLNDPTMLRLAHLN